MTIPNDIVKRVEDKILDTLLLLQKRYPNANLEIPKWQWTKMGRTAGRAHYGLGLVELNPDFITNHLEELINQTLPHEIAHLASFKIYGILGKGHGRFWKSVMYALAPLGVQVKRCHDYSLDGVTTRVRPRPYEYVCGCKDKTIKVTSNIHNKIQRGQKRFCIRCKVTIKLKSLVQQAA